MLTASVMEKMIAYSKGNLHDIDHFLKVWALAKTIGEQEGLDAHTQELLELAAIVHDIACPLCREKYGDTNGEHQERESPPLVERFFCAAACRSRRCGAHFVGRGPSPYLYECRRAGSSDPARGGFPGQCR